VHHYKIEGVFYASFVTTLTSGLDFRLAGGV
jgi:hypothetical protein